MFEDIDRLIFIFTQIHFYINMKLRATMNMNLHVHEGMISFAYKWIAYSIVCLHHFYLQIDCLYALLHTNKNFRNGVTFGYMYYCLHVYI